MKLFQYRVDGRESILPKNVYADNVSNSLRKWIDYINETATTRGQDRTELKNLVNQGQLYQIKRVDNSQHLYWITLTSEGSRLTVFIDEIEITPDFIADLKYFPTENGGRKGFAASGYRPHVRFPFSQNMTSGEQIFWERDIVFPGETVRAQIRILDHETFRNALNEGMEFEFCEGANVVGTGTIVEIRNKELKKASD
jgi:hypothetical protein